MEVGLLAGIDAVAILEDRHVMDEAVPGSVRDVILDVDHAELLGGRKRGTGCYGRFDDGLYVQKHL